MKLKQNTNLSINYPVCFERDIFSMPVKPFWFDLTKADEKADAIFYVDENVMNLHSKLECQISEFVNSFSGISKFKIKTVLPGESLKNDFSSVMKIVDELVEEKLCRHSYVFIIGGGATLDAVGFAASITHRGIRQIRIPTTVLSQDDSAVGVKNGINYKNLKNLLGTFYAPHAVVCDSNFLTTLSNRDWIAGVSEAYKVAVIKDADFLNILIQNAEKVTSRDMDFMEKLIQRSAEIHLNHIKNGGDPFEMGSSRPLDFGHWSGHKLEIMSGNSLRHGEAVAIGIALDLSCCVELEFITEADAKPVIEGMKRSGLPVWSELLEKKADNGLEIIEGLQEFREHIGGTLTLTMPKPLGTQTEIHDLSEEVITNALNRLKHLVK